MSNIAHDDAREVIRAWFNRVLATKGWTPHHLAKVAQVSQATISRALDADADYVTSTKTIEKIVRATGISAPTGIGMTGNAVTVGPGGLAEPEAIYIEDAGSELAPLEVSGPQAIWQLKSRGIELAGYHFDDFLLVDPAVQPMLRDAICVQIYDLKSGRAETVFRIFDPPFAITETADPAARRKPVTIDHERASIWGVVVKSLRVRRRS